MVRVPSQFCGAVGIATALLLTACGDGGGANAVADADRVANEIAQAGGKVERSKSGSKQDAPAGAGVIGLTLAKTTANDAQIAGWINQSPSLETIELSGCDAAGPETWAAIARSTRLRRLRLNGTSVGNEALTAFGQCAGLRVLSLDDTAVTDVARLAPLKNLQWLSLVRAPVTDDGLEGLGSLPELRFLRLRGTKISDRGLAAVARFERLATLDLSETSVGDAGIAHLAGLVELEDVNLWKTNIGDAALSHALGWKRLRRLNLDDDTALTDAGLIPLTRLGTLEFLHLGNTQLTDAGLRAFSQVKGLRELIVTECPQVTPAGIRDFRAALPEATLRE